MRDMKTNPKSLKNQIHTIIHDFLTDPLYYLVHIFSWVLMCVLIGGFALSAVPFFLKKI